MFNPFANIQQTMQQFNEFRQNFQGDPKAQVQQMLNSGQMSQEQLNGIIPIAQRFYNLMHANKHS